MSAKKTGLLIIDAHAMAYRAYFSMAQQNFTNPVSGLPTGAIYGFFRMLFKVSRDLQPAGIAVVWDPPGGKSFRNDLYSKYKEQRKPMPDDMRPQIDEIKQLVKKCGYKDLMIKGFEADDVIGTLAMTIGKKGKVTILSGDKDCFQLLGKNVNMLRPKKGVSDFVNVNAKWVKEELDVTPKQIIDYMALIGDSSDNIPGAKGIGPKSASKLINEFKTVEKIYKSTDKLPSGALRNKLIESRENVFLSKALVTIKTDLEEIQDLEISDFEPPDLSKNETLQLFRKLGFNQLYNDLKKAKETGIQGSGDLKASDTNSFDPKKVKYKLISTEDALIDCLKVISRDLKNSKNILSIDTETNHPQPMLATLVGVSLCCIPGKAYYITSLPKDSDFFSESISHSILKKHLDNFFNNNSKIKLVGQNIKYDMIVLRNAGIDLPAVYFDTMLASYLCNPNIRRHNMDDMALDLLEYTTINFESVAGKGKNKTTLDKIPATQITNYACEDADITLQLYHKLEVKTKELHLDKVMQDIEVKLIEVLMNMEICGVAIDSKYFSNLSREYSKKIDALEKKIFKCSGYDFNIRSTNELQKVLFEELKLPHGKKTKTGYSTDQSVLEDLQGQHIIIDSLLQYRKYTKLKSTYIDALPLQINPNTGRIHTSFHQAIAATGRLSSIDPNLQNIPIREESGRAIRRGFIPAKGRELLSLDYSQIELRIMAHYSNDPALIEAFTSENIDIHKRTAASLFETTEDLVDADMRSQGKTVNFAIIYGVTEFGLSKNLGISREEARAYIERFFSRYPGVREYMDDTIAFAQKNGYVQTLSGRRRQITDINSSNRFRKEAAQRTAINSPIQGTSADIIKIAMIEIHKELRTKKLKSTMILQVHDELLFDVVPDEKDTIWHLAKNKMENAMHVNVPLKVEFNFGSNWDESH